METAYGADGDHRADVSAAAFTQKSSSWYFLEGVDVAGKPARGRRDAVVAFGDSLTDGAASTPGADKRYPDQLSRRLSAEGRQRPVLNAGIAGNRVLSDSACFGAKAPTRFRHDALDQTRSEWVPSSCWRAPTTSSWARPPRTPAPPRTGA
ncbi:GDSL-type esterase/lipase family protein [Streptomyces sp. YH02]|uniref:GDSL-type esterase/lipase family protein n=1 Tax=Streptomyces sp. YH02 TaxID=3256999 RepID=UPI0037580669